MCALQLVALCLGEERTDRFGRVSKTRIVFIHLHLRNDRDRFLLPARGQAIVERLLDQVANPALSVLLKRATPLRTPSVWGR